MILLPDLEFYSTTLNDFNYSNRENLDILFNKNNQFVLNRKVIDNIEEKIHPDNIEYFKSFIRELIDDGRLENINDIEPENYLETSIKYYEISNNEFLIPIKSSEVSGFKKDCFHNLLDINSTNEYDVILKQLLSTSYIQLTYQDFESNNQIDEYLENLFSIPKFINEVHCFNRDISFRFIDRFGRRKINYYTLIKQPVRNYISEYRATKKEFTQKVSGKFKLFTITNRSLIHERKIFINNLCISFDNAFENILVEEPTWEISITYSKNKFENWKKKINQFIPIK